MGLRDRLFNSDGRKADHAQRERNHSALSQLSSITGPTFGAQNKQRNELFKSRGGVESNPDRGERDKRDQTLEASLYVSQRKVGGAEHAAGSVTS